MSMNLKYIVNVATEKESQLFYSSTENNQDRERGCIGHVRGDFGSGTQFHTTFWNHCDELKTQEFKSELDTVVNQLRTTGELLNNLSAMSVYCDIQPKAKLSSWNDCTYGYKVETDKYSYYIRCCTVRGEYNFYIYCYCREYLMQFLERT